MCVFYKTPNMNTRFLKSLNVNSINSFLVNLTDIVVVSIYFGVNKQIFVNKSNDYYNNDQIAPLIAFIYLPIWAVLYTFGGLKYLLNYKISFEIKNSTK